MKSFTGGALSTGRVLDQGRATNDLANDDTRRRLRQNMRRICIIVRQQATVVRKSRGVDPALTSEV